jgi:PPOX class probable F420-dependent enzyme
MDNPITIPASHLDLLTTKKAFAHLGTVNDDGSLQVTPVWIDFDGKHVVFNSAKGRAKDRNLESRKTVALAVSDPDNPYRYVEVRGTVVEITETGAEAHIDSLAMKYMGQEKYPFRKAGEVRRIYRIQPTKVTTMG